LAIVVEAVGLSHGYDEKSSTEYDVAEQRQNKLVNVKNREVDELGEDGKV
jgi:hypothetical protein